MATTSQPVPAEDSEVPFSRVANLVRHLTHDIRNGLNTLDLQTALLREIVTDAEGATEVKRLREMISGTTKMLQAFSANFWLAEPQCVTYSAKIFLEDFRARLNQQLGGQAAQITWKETLGEEAISVDLEMILRGMIELFRNAFQFREKDGAIAARAFVEGQRLVLEIDESKSSLSSPPETWGLEPLVSARRDGYGMGLFQARRIFAVHRAELTFAFDPAAKRLTTRLSLPLAEG